MGSYAGGLGGVPALPPRYSVDKELAVMVMDYLRSMGCIQAAQELSSKTGIPLEEVSPRAPVLARGFGTRRRVARLDNTPHASKTKVS